MISANGGLPAHRYTPQVTPRWPRGSEPASPVWDVWSTMLIGPWNPYTDRVSTGVSFYNNCLPVHGPMPHKIENPASQFFLPVPANAPTTLLCEPFKWGPVWDVWSTILIGPWNPYTDRVWTGVFFYNNCQPIH